MIINGINYEVVITKKKIKKIYVRVKSDLKIYVNAPTKMPLNQIEKFLIECLPWLEKAITKQKDSKALCQCTASLLREAAANLCLCTSGK